MPQRCAQYDPHQTAPTGEPKPQPPTPPANTVAEPAPPAYSIEPGWIDAAGRTRTWALHDPRGTQMAEITTKTAARKLAQLLNNVMGDERGTDR